MSASGPADPAATGGGDAAPPGPGPGPGLGGPMPGRPGPVPVPVPPGPGVVPPFPAPPIEGRTARLWWGIGVGAVAVLLCCGGGIAAMIGLTVVAERAFNEQATTVIGRYLDALRDEQYETAYGLLCDELQDSQTPAEFADRVTTQDDIRSFEVGKVTIASTDSEVPVEVIYDDGRTDTWQVRLQQDGSTGEFEVCGVEE